MNKQKIEKIQKVSSAIENFRDAYNGNELWGDIDGRVSAEELMSFLIENPHFQEIASEIKRLDV